MIRALTAIMMFPPESAHPHIYMTWSEGSLAALPSFSTSSSGSNQATFQENSDTWCQILDTAGKATKQGNPDTV